MVGIKACRFDFVDNRETTECLCSSEQINDIFSLQGLSDREMERKSPRPKENR